MVTTENPCGECRGTGEITDDTLTTITCSDCQGTTVSRFNPDEPCSGCRGEGVVEEAVPVTQTCGTCRGTGDSPYPTDPQ